jgi:outer membrane protein assembly factor BamB
MTGKKYWEAELGGDIVALPMIKDGVVYVAAKYDSGQSKDIFKDENQNEPTMILRALDKSTGVTQWQTALEPAERLYLASFENYIVAIGGNGHVISVNRIDENSSGKNICILNCPRRRL